MMTATSIRFFISDFLYEEICTQFHFRIRTGSNAEVLTYNLITRPGAGPSSCFLSFLSCERLLRTIISI